MKLMPTIDVVEAQVAVESGLAVVDFARVGPATPPAVPVAVALIALAWALEWAYDPRPMHRDEHQSDDGSSASHLEIGGVDDSRIHHEDRGHPVMRTVVG